MKNIELTENHKSKLLEMCKELFPEYYEWKFEDDQLYFTDIKAFSYYLHWFEFCMTYLINTLYWNDKYRDSPSYDVNLHVELTLSMLNHKTHPVDYLYQEFKKI